MTVDELIIILRGATYDFEGLMKSNSFNTIIEGSFDTDKLERLLDDWKKVEK